MQMKAFPLVNRPAGLEETLSFSPRKRTTRLNTTGSRTSRQTSLEAALKKTHPRDISSYLDRSLYPARRQLPYTVHTSDFPGTHPLLRPQIRETLLHSEAKVSQRDQLHDQTVAVLTVCRPLTAELDLTNGISYVELVSFQLKTAETSDESRFEEWKSVKAARTEDQLLLERRRRCVVSHSYEFSMKRPQSACREDYYAAKFLGDPSKTGLFAQILKDLDLVPGQKQALWGLFDLILASRRDISESDTLSAVAKDLTSRLSSLLTTNSPKSMSELVDQMSLLTQQQRLILKEANSPHIAQALGLVWKLAVVTLDQAFQLVLSEGEKGKRDLQVQLAAKDAEMAVLVATLSAEWQGKLGKLQEELKRQASITDHLRAEKANLMSILSDRNDEIAQLKLPPNLKDFDRLLEEMSSYLAEAEDRQGSQAQLLDTISQMLDTSQLRGRRKHRKVGDGEMTPKSAMPFVKQVSLSPALRPSFHPSPPKAEERSFFRMMTADMEGTQSSKPAITQLAVPSTGERAPPPPPIQTHCHSDSSLSEEPSEPQFTDQPAQTDLTGWDSSVRSQALSIPPSLLQRELDKVPKHQPPLSESNLFRFAEQVFEEKFKLDVFREEQRQKYDSLPEFLLSYLYAMSGLKSVVWKTLSSVMGAMEKVALSESAYGQLICKLFAVFNYGSVPLELEVFLTKAQAAFTRIFPAYLKTYPEYGGSVPLVELSDLVSMLFPCRWDTIGRILDHCCPAELSEAETVGLLICGKLGKLGRDMKYFFIQMDTEKCGSVPFRAFVEGVRHVLGVGIRPEKLKKYWTEFETDRLSFSHLSAINVKELAFKAASKAALVTRTQFLIAIIQEYDYLRTLEIQRLISTFHASDINGDGILTLDEFSDLIRSIDPAASQPSIAVLYSKALEKDTVDESNVDCMSPEAFCRVAIEEKLGGAGNFGFELRLEKCNPMLKQLLENENSGGKSPLKRKNKRPA